MGATAVTELTMHANEPYTLLITVTDDDGSPVAIKAASEFSGYIADDYSTGGTLLETLHGAVYAGASGQGVLSLSEAEVNALQASATFASVTDHTGDLGFLVGYLNQVSDGDTVTGVSQANKTFTVGDDITDLWPGGAATLAGGTVTVSGSTGNDGTYTIAKAVVSGGNTTVTVLESLPSAVADGTLTASYQKCVVQANVEYQRGTVEA